MAPKNRGSETGGTQHGLHRVRGSRQLFVAGDQLETVSELQESHSEERRLQPYEMLEGLLFQLIDPFCLVCFCFSANLTSAGCVKNRGRSTVRPQGAILGAIGLKRYARLMRNR